MTSLQQVAPCTQGRRRAFGVLAGLLLVVVALIGGGRGVPPVHAASVGLSDGTGNIYNYEVYGPNATVMITGDLSGGCISNLGIFSANVYVVPHGGSASPGATPNAVIVSGAGAGGFADEIIGFTAPSGKLGAGDYDIVMDLCPGSNPPNLFDYGFDQAHGAFSVQIPANVPLLPSADIQAIKNSAQQQASHWEQATGATGATFALFDAYSLYSDILGGGPAEAIVGLWLDVGCNYMPSENIGGVSLPTLWCPTASWTNIAKLQSSVLTQMLGEAAHYQAIANDPPDDGSLVTLGPTSTIAPQSADPVHTALAQLGTQSSTESATLGALLGAIQNYDGAQQASNGPAALLQAESIQQYARMTAQELQTTNTVLGNASSAISSSGADIAGESNYFANTLLPRLQQSGFTASETANFQSLGMSPTDISNLQTTLTKTAAQNPDLLFTLDRYQTDGPFASAASTLQAANTNTAQQLQQLATDMGPIITNLQGQVGTPELPTASAGGPYSGSVGSPISFNAAASTTPAGTGPLSYAWDLLGNGTFTDASGPTPSFSFSAPRSGFVGVKVTNALGESAVAYAPISVTGTAAPAISSISVSPAPAAATQPVIPVDVTSGSAPVTFTANATGAASYQWTLDGTPVGASASYSKTFSVADQGVHALQLTVSNAGGSAYQGLVLLVSSTPTVFSGSIALAPATSQLKLGSTVSLTATVTDSGGHPVANTPVRLTVTGANPSVFKATTNASGVASFSYKGTAQGADTLIAGIGSTVSNLASVYWTGETILAKINSPIGVAASRDRLYVSQYYNLNYVYSLDSSGNTTLFATLPNSGGGERYLAISPGLGGFPANTLYVTDSGTIYSISADGKTVTPFVFIPAINGSSDTGITFDHTGAFGYDMLVTSTSGAVWRVNASGQATLVKNTGNYLENPVVAPASFAPFGGDLLATDENNSEVYAIAPDGTVSTVVSVPDAEAVHVIPATVCSYGTTGDAFFTATFGSNTVTAFPVSDFTGLAGDILVTSEFAGTETLLTSSNGTITASPFYTGLPQQEGSAFLDCSVPLSGRPSGPLPQLSLAPATTAATTGTTATLTATLTNVTNLSGVPVSFSVLGPNAQTLSATTDANGNASVTYTGAYAGADTVEATATAQSAGLTSNAATVTWTGSPPVQTIATTLTYTGATSGDFSDPVTVSATLTDANGAPLAGVLLPFVLGSGANAPACTAATDATGTASCTLTPDQPAGNQTLRVSFAGRGADAPSQASPNFSVNHEETSLDYEGTTIVAQGSGAVLAGRLLDHDGLPAAGRSVSFSLGSQSCTGTTDVSGLAVCLLSNVTQPTGHNALTATFAGDGSYQAAIASATLSVEGQHSTALGSISPVSGEFGDADRHLAEPGGGHLRQVRRLHAGQRRWRAELRRHDEQQRHRELHADAQPTRRNFQPRRGLRGRRRVPQERRDGELQCHAGGDADRLQRPDRDRQRAERHAFGHARRRGEPGRGRDGSAARRQEHYAQPRQRRRRSELCRANRQQRYRELRHRQRQAAAGPGYRDGELRG